MTATVAPAPATLERGIANARAAVGCEIDGVPQFHPGKKRWWITASLTIPSGGRFVPKRTKWCVLVEGDYPFGSVGFYPAADGGITATFPHQERNLAPPQGEPWRAGKLCLDSPFRGERRRTTVRDPVGDAEARLRWHFERAHDWLESAAAGSLLAVGDPLELPARTTTTKKAWTSLRVVHDESAASFEAWTGRAGTLGRARLGRLAELSTVLVVAGFTDDAGQVVREWAGRVPQAKPDDPSALWWLWPGPVIIEPWQSPYTWGELRIAGRAAGVDVDGVLRAIAPDLRDKNTDTILLVGYPIAARVGSLPTEVHWDAVLLPRLPSASGKPPKGFRPNARGWWKRDRLGGLADRATLECVDTENWSPERLQARGRIPTTVRSRRVALVGLGSLGSTLAELLVRGGLTNIALFDDDVVTAGNVCRHTATLADVGTRKTRVVRDRLVQISPFVLVTEMPALDGGESTVVHTLEPYDVVIDCTASDDLLARLALGWWPVSRVFASFSLGFAAKKLFSFAVSGQEFPRDVFLHQVGPMLEEDAAEWVVQGELLEGAGCWSPLFPARYDDVVSAAAICLKELETALNTRPRQPRFRVFERQEDSNGFRGFVARTDQHSQLAPQHT